MSLADRLARQLSDNNLEFKEVWEDPERQQQFDLSCRLVELRKEQEIDKQIQNQEMSLPMNIEDTQISLKQLSKNQ